MPSLLQARDERILFGSAATTRYLAIATIPAAVLRPPSNLTFIYRRIGRRESRFIPPLSPQTTHTSTTGNVASASAVSSVRTAAISGASPPNCLAKI